MNCISSFWAHVFMTAYLLWVTGCVAQKVYFDCGAKVDVVDVQGLILSPGFPYNYSAGTHCVWQFFVPVGHQLILEMFDFDVFESQEPPAQDAAVPSDPKEDDTETGGGTTFPPGGPALDRPPTQRVTAKGPQSSQNDEVKQVVVQEQSSKIDFAKVSNSAKRLTSNSTFDPAPTQSHLHLLVPGARAPTGKAVNSITSSSLHGKLDINPNPRASAQGLAVVVGEAITLTPPIPTDTESLSPDTQPSVMDACPHDVLYISDLLTFSSRFCGSNRPSGSQLVFGSSQEMVEVIMELITTTHWGRGFALLFQYHNQTHPPQHAYTPDAAGKVDSLLVAMSGAAFFAMVLTSALCIVFRPKLCPKRSGSNSSSNSEVHEGVQNSGAEVSELQLVVANQPCLEVPGSAAENDNNNHHSLSTTRTGSPVAVGGDAEVDLSSIGLMELELGADEVFTVSSVTSPSSRQPFSAHTQRERFLRHSDTGTGPVSGRTSPDAAASPTATRASQDGSASCGRSRPRAWSVRTFQDFLPPLPQLHKKWCSWNSTSPFTKLVDSAPPSLVSACRGEDNRKVLSDPQLEAQNDSIASDSSTSTASYPLTQPTQRQRRLNSTSNLRRSRFTGPCFGLLSGSSPSDSAKAPGGPHLQASTPEPSNGQSGQGGIPRDFPAESDHVSVPVFAICEEEDRQPLVLAEHLSSMLNGLSRGPHDGKGPTAGCSNPGPQIPANGPLFQRGRSEWRPWGSQASGGANPHPLPSDLPTATSELESAFMHSTASQIQMPSLSQSTVLQ